MTAAKIEQVLTAAECVIEMRRNRGFEQLFKRDQVGRFSSTRETELLQSRLTSHRARALKRESL